MRKKKKEFTQIYAPMFPLVDMLFSTVGILLILIAIMNILQSKVHISPPIADLVIVCREKNNFYFYSSDFPQGLSVAMYSLNKQISKFLKNRDQVLNLQIAFDGESYREKNMLIKKIHDIRKKWNQDQIKKSAIEMMMWPLSDSSDLPPVISLWQKRNNDHEFPGS